MPKCDSKKVAKQLYCNHTSAWVFSYKFAAYFQNTFSQEHLWTAAFGTQEFFRNFESVGNRAYFSHLLFFFRPASTE